MKPRADYTGKKFGLLTVVSCVEPSDGKNKGGLWMCKCKCRRFANFTGYQLHSRNSCGCLGRKAAVERGKLLRKSEEEKEINAGYRRYKKAVKDLNRKWPDLNLKTVSKEEWLKTAGSPCSYCGDTGLSDVIENIPMCRVCQNIKGKMSHDQFKEHIGRIQLSKK